MFTTGQLIFAVSFFVVFIILMVYSYRGDKKLHKKHYKRNVWVLIAFILFVIFLVILKTVLQ